jgi:hypothetical protein
MYRARISRLDDKINFLKEIIKEWLWLWIKNKLYILFW